MRRVRCDCKGALCPRDNGPLIPEHCPTCTYYRGAGIRSVAETREVGRYIECACPWTPCVPGQPELFVDEACLSIEGVEQLGERPDSR